MLSVLKNVKPDLCFDYYSINELIAKGSYHGHVAMPCNNGHCADFKIM